MSGRKLPHAPSSPRSTSVARGAAAVCALLALALGADGMMAIATAQTAPRGPSEPPTMPTGPQRAGPMRRMPDYRGDAGTAIDDPARMRGEQAAFEAAYKAYKEAAAEFRDEVREFIQDEIVQRQKKVAGLYQTQIDKIDDEQTKLRKEAIERLEAFIFRHREHDKYTPDALFRLAELYFEDSNDEFNKSFDNYDKNLDLYNRGKLLDPPTEKEKEFSRSVAVYKYLHWVPQGTRMEPLSGRLAGVVLPKRWPDYRNADAALYLQGYCEAEMGLTDKAIATLSSLQKHYPKSTYIAEAWLRVGELYFEDNEFEQAADAYKQAADTKDPKMYGLALYKLGWSYFQMYRYPEAVAWFQTLIEYYDEELPRKRAEAKAKGETIAEDAQGGNLRKEAVEYLAKSLAEPTWDDDGCDDFGSEDSKGDCAMVHPRLRPRLYTSSVLEPDLKGFENWQSSFQGEPLAGLQRAVAGRADVRKRLSNGKPYVREILMEYGKALMDQAEDEYYRQGVLVLSHVVDKWPMEREAQALQKQIIRAVDLLASAYVSYQMELTKKPTNVEAQLGLELAKEAMDRQITERRKYLNMFSPGTPWYEKWGGDRELATQVQEMLAEVRMQFAQLIHSQAQQMRIAGQEEAAIAKYAEAAAEYETLFKADPASENAYRLAYTIADVYFFSGKRCDGMRNVDGDQKGELVLTKEREVMPWPAERVPVIKSACVNLKRSVAYYDIVRDWKGAKGKDEEGKPLDYTEDAAFSSIQANQRVLAARAAYPINDAERLAGRMMPEIAPDEEADDKLVEAVKEAPAPVRVVRQDLDRSVIDWIRSVDGYVASGVTSKDDPQRREKLNLMAAQLLYKNRHFDPWKEQPHQDLTPEFWSARLRMEFAISEFPRTKASKSALQDLLTSYRMEADIDGMKAIRNKYAEQLDKADIEDIDKKLRTIYLGAIAKRAEALEKEGETALAEANQATDPAQAFQLHEKSRKLYERAADEYKRLRSETDDINLKKQILVNARVLYYRAEKWDQVFESLDLAEQILREALDKKKSDDGKPLTQKQLDDSRKALIDVVDTRAKLQFQFFRVPEAIANFREVYKLDPEGQKGIDGLLNAARLAFRNSEYDLAIQLDEEVVRRFSKDSKKKDTVDEANWRITESYQKKGNQDDHIRSLFTYVERYKNDRSQSGTVFKALQSIARMYRARGDKKKEFALWTQLIADFDKGGFQRTGGPEATAAAEGQFWLMEPRYNDFLKTKLQPNPKSSAGAQIKQLQTQLRAMLDTVLGTETKKKNPDTGQEYMVRDGGLYKEYLEKVALYGSQNWSYAAMLYRAQALQHLARTIYGVQPPNDLTEEEEEAYAEQIEAVGAQIENQAIKSLEAALKDAEAKGAVNEWVAKLRAAINKYKPADYPLLKEAKTIMADPQGTPPSLDKELR